MCANDDVNEPMLTTVRSIQVRDISSNPMKQVDISEADGMQTGETRMIVSALFKLSYMLQIGFGKAGASIIEQNFKLTHGEPSCTVITALALTP